MKYWALLFFMTISSATSYFAFSTPYLSDAVYSLRAPMSGDKICSNRHFYPMEERIEALANEVSFFYAYDAQQSQQVESVYFRIKDNLNLAQYNRYPIVFDLEFNEAAIWGEVLTQTGVAEKVPGLILKSYEVFLSAGADATEAFDHEFATLNIAPDIFHRITVENDFSKELAGHRDILYDIGPKLLPFAVVKGKYLVYPGSFADIRDGWMIVNYLYNNTDEQTASGCKL